MASLIAAPALPEVTYAFHPSAWNLPDMHLWLKSQNPPFLSRRLLPEARQAGVKDIVMFDWGCHCLTASTRFSFEDCVPLLGWLPSGSGAGPCGPPVTQQEHCAMKQKSAVLWPKPSACKSFEYLVKTCKVQLASQPI